jgi:lipopolysaccharide export system ATP-binding protein
VSRKSSAAKKGAGEKRAGPTQPPREPMLHAEGLVKRYGRSVVVDHVTIEVAPGEVVGLLGANGAGKTTTFGMLVGLVQPTAGKITFNGVDVTRAPMHRRARSGLAYLAQEPSVFRDLTTRENILAVLEFQPMDRRARLARAEQLLEEMDIARVADSKADVLSGGERRRVEIARALATDPKVFLLDEPFAGIDPIVLADLQQGVIALKRRGIGVLITDHNVRETLMITDRAYILSEGRVLIAGTPVEIASSRAAREAYLGEGFRMDFKDASI